MKDLDSENTPKEKYWNIALDKTSSAVIDKALIPLNTKIYKIYNHSNYHFEVRMLISKEFINKPNYTKNINPFSPWDKRLEIAHIHNKHVLILNKYPVQIGHMLLITNTWSPQDGWLDKSDFKALESVEKDTSGLWFFNSSRIAGASQPHRHIQLLRRSAGECICPRYEWFRAYLRDELDHKSNLFRSCLVLNRKMNNSKICSLYEMYIYMCKELYLGNPSEDPKPLKGYNLIITEDLIALIVRSKDNNHGFSINGLGFAGYMLATELSQIDWLEKFGPEELISEVVEIPL